MLKKEGEVFVIKNWNKYQSLDRQEDYLIKNRERQRRFSEKLKKEQEKTNVSLTLDNATEEKRKDNKRNKKRRKYNRGGKQRIQKIQIMMKLYTIDSKNVNFVVKNYNQQDLIIYM